MLRQFNLQFKGLRVSLALFEWQTNTHQVAYAKLKAAGILPVYLMHQVQPLQENRTTLVDLLRVGTVARAIGKLMAEIKPLTLDENPKALDRFQKEKKNKEALETSLLYIPPLSCSRDPGRAAPSPQFEASYPSHPSSAPAQGVRSFRWCAPRSWWRPAGPKDAASTWFSPADQTNCGQKCNVS